jgi:UDP-N-acetylmuramyl pentapeptide phosphotransferase/UDP-N-acetylglucosamine-1-phosphate transferase
MVGGMLTATALTLVVLPAIYLLWRRWQVQRTPEAAVQNVRSGQSPIMGGVVT